MTDGFLPYFASGVLASLVVGAAVFITIRKQLKLRWYVNLPGALLATLAAFMFHGWLLTRMGVMEVAMGTSFGGVPWQSPATLLAVTIIWYMLPWFVSKQLDWILPWWHSRN